MEATEHMSLEDKLSAIQDKWVNSVHDLNAAMKTLPSLNDLLNKVYASRQDAVDYYHSLMTTLMALSRKYNADRVELYKNLKMGTNGLRYTNETAINNQIEAVLIDQKKQIQLINNHIEYMKETIKTIDNMIFGIGQKIKVYELLNGIKK